VPTLTLSSLMAHVTWETIFAGGFEDGGVVCQVLETM